MAQFEFDINSVEKSENSYELLPAGWYAAQIIESKIESLKSGNGQGLKLTLEVLQDGYRGRRIWTQINVRHTDEETEKRGQKSLRQMCEAVGLSRFGDTVETHHRPLRIRVRIRKDESGRYEDQNDVNGFQPAASGAAPMAAAAPRSAAPAANAPAAGAVPPWQKRAA